jgi:hypothetical protein
MKLTTEQILEEIDKSLKRFDKEGLSYNETKFHTLVYADGQIPKKFWKSVGITCSGDELDIVFEEEMRLADLGIVFDTGYGFGQRDWELDWSLSQYDYDKS